MGLPIVHTFANVFMCNLERKYIETCPEEFFALFYRRYVDYTFVAFRDKNHASLLLDFLNQQHPNISFTMERESDNKLAFLDAFECRNATGFDVSVHRKSTFSGLGISFFSHCAQKLKVNSIKSILSRAYGICYYWHNLHNEFQFLVTFFFDNGFPIKLFDLCLARFLSDKFSDNSDVLRNTQQIFAVFPYFGHQSQIMQEE